MLLCFQLDAQDVRVVTLVRVANYMQYADEAVKCQENVLSRLPP